MINTAPQGSNSVNGREKYFNIHYKHIIFFSGPCVPVQDFTLEQVGVQVQILAGLLQFFFSIVFYT